MQLVPSGVRINTNGWLNMMEDFVVPSLGAEVGPGWVLIMDNAASHTAQKAFRVIRSPTSTSQAWSSSAVNRQDTHSTRKRHAVHEQHPDIYFHSSSGIGRVIFQPACSPDLNPVDPQESRARLATKNVFTNLM